MHWSGVRSGPAGAGEPPRPGAHGLLSSFSGDPQASSPLRGCSIAQKRLARVGQENKQGTQTASRHPGEGREKGGREGREKWGRRGEGRRTHSDFSKEPGHPPRRGRIATMRGILHPPATHGSPGARGCRARTRGRPTNPATPRKSTQLVVPSEEQVTRGADKPRHPEQLRSARQAEQGGPGSRQAQPPQSNAPHARTRGGRQAQPPCPGEAASRQRAGHFAPLRPPENPRASKARGTSNEGGRRAQPSPRFRAPYAKTRGSR